MDELEFYDRRGTPFLYSPDGENLYFWSGEPAGFISDGKIYRPNGRFDGWFEDGWLRDRNGDCVGFSEDSVGGPIRPVRQARPPKSMRQLFPLKGLLESAPVRAINTLNWADEAGLFS